MATFQESFDELGEAVEDLQRVILAYATKLVMPLLKKTRRCKK